MQTALLLTISIIFEVTASSTLKLTDGFKRVIPTIIVIVCYLISFYSLSLVLHTLPLGIAYAIWGGLGTVLTSVIGVIYYQEKITLLKIGAILLIVTGVLLLNIFGGGR